MTAKRGSVEYLSAIMLVCFGGILLLYSISVKETKLCQIKTRDSLDSACLAAAVIDVDRFCADRTIYINDSLCAWNIFLDSLKTSMELDDALNCCNSKVVKKVKVCSFRVYNIKDDYMAVFLMNEDGRSSVYAGHYNGNETTPDGTVIESATIYADISLELCGFMNISNTVHVTSSVDIVKN